MENSEKLAINKSITSYNGKNTFIIALKGSLSSRYCGKMMIGEKKYKCLSDKQYEVAKSIFTSETNDATRD